MNEPKETIVAATEADADALVTVKPKYSGTQVAERFRWLREDVDGTWLLLKLDDTVIGWCVAVWSGKKTHPGCPIYAEAGHEEAMLYSSHGDNLEGVKCRCTCNQARGELPIPPVFSGTHCVY